METNTSKQYYSMNLSPDYLPDWGSWEVIREIVSNAIDASKENDSFYNIDVISDDEVIVMTPCYPSISQMLVIGAGTKSADSNTIGQFGEGMKMAALACIRSGGEIVFESQNERVVFEFIYNEQIKTEVLHAVIEETNNTIEGFKCHIKMENIGTHNKKFIDVPFGPFTDKDEDEKTCSLFVKGVFINTTSNFSYDWNLDKIEMNRDRTFVDPKALALAILSWMQLELKKPDEEQNVNLHKILRTCVYKHVPEISLISNSTFYNIFSEELKSFVKKEFNKFHGEKTSISFYENDCTTKLRQLGYKILTLSTVSVSFLERCGIKTDIMMYEEIKDSMWDIVFECDYTKDIKDTIKILDKLTSIVNATKNKVVLFKAKNDINANTIPLGFVHQIYDEFLGIDEQNIYLNVALFEEYRTNDLYAVFLHELAHVMSNSTDGTIKFEEELTRMLGHLAVGVLK